MVDMIDLSFPPCRSSYCFHCLPCPRGASCCGFRSQGEDSFSFEYLNNVAKSLVAELPLTGLLYEENLGSNPPSSTIELYIYLHNVLC